ncbi:MAG: hypothetical protein AAGK47_07390, partial [Bacteroidota bacterium]
MSVEFVMWIGFILASYSVVGNDVIQTLGTFLTSNEKRVKWYVLWAFASSIMIYALVNGYLNNDVDYGRLDKFDLSSFTYSWYYLLPPLVLLFITRSGIPVSTTFMVLTLFSLSEIPGDLNSMIGSVFDGEAKLGGMIQKSLIGYVIAFSSAIIIYLGITRLTEKRFLNNPLTEQYRPLWIGLQWLSTGFLWFQWLTQDLANIYVYLQGGVDLSVVEFAVSLIILVGLLGYIFYQSGGRVQDVVRAKTNTDDIRSATFIDFIYGIILYIFKYNYLGLFEAKLPASNPINTQVVLIGSL